VPPNNKTESISHNKIRQGLEFINQAELSTIIGTYAVDWKKTKIWVSVIP
jgi:hypothetical protein